MGLFYETEARKVFCEVRGGKGGTWWWGGGAPRGEDGTIGWRGGREGWVDVGRWGDGWWDGAKGGGTCG